MITIIGLHLINYFCLDIMRFLPLTAWYFTRRHISAKVIFLPNILMLLKGHAVKIFILHHCWILSSNWYKMLMLMLELELEKNKKHVGTCYYWKIINFGWVTITPLHARPRHTTLLCFISYILYYNIKYLVILC